MVDETTSSATKQFITEIIGNFFFFIMVIIRITVLDNPSSRKCSFNKKCFKRGFREVARAAKSLQ